MKRITESLRRVTLELKEIREANDAITT